MTGNARYANGHRRRLLRARVVAAADVCQWEHCPWPGEPFDKALDYLPGEHGPRCARAGCTGCVPHPRRIEVDEIVPVSKGGDPLARSNVRALHRWCNQQRGNGTRSGGKASAKAKRITLATGLLPTTRQW